MHPNWQLQWVMKMHPNRQLQWVMELPQVSQNQAANRKVQLALRHMSVMCLELWECGDTADDYLRNKKFTRDLNKMTPFVQSVSRKEGKANIGYSAIYATGGTICLV